jgi:hypothetical protein
MHAFGSWANNCAAVEATNGADVTNSSISARNRRDLPLRARANIIDGSAIQAIGLPGPFVPDLPQVDSNSGVIKSYILPDGKTGVVRVFGICACEEVNQRFLRHRCLLGHSRMTLSGSRRIP